MSLIRRRGLLAGIGAMLAVPAIIRTPGLLMPVKPAVERSVLFGMDFGLLPPQSVVTWVGVIRSEILYAGDGPELSAMAVLLRMKEVDKRFAGSVIVA